MRISDWSSDVCSSDLDEFARLGRAQVIANAFSYVRGYGLRLLPVIQSRSQLRNVYGEHGADEIVSNCGVEIAFTPKELRVAKELSERVGYLVQDAESRSLTIHVLLAHRSKTIPEQRRALTLPQELMQLPEDDIPVLRGGLRTEGRRVGQEGVSTGRSRGWP